MVTPFLNPCPGHVFRVEGLGLGNWSMGPRVRSSSLAYVGHTKRFDILSIDVKLLELLLLLYDSQA